MTVSASFRISILIAAAVFGGGCSNMNGLSTSSVASETAVTAQKTDPVCVSLANQITTLKGDGAIDRLEKAAAGKGSKVEVKRTTLQKQAELNRANADYQLRCGPQLPKQVAMQTPATAPVAEIGRASCRERV